MDDALLTRLRAALREAADPARAPAMQAYMKSSMPYHGVPTPKLRSVCKQVFADVELPSAETGGTTCSRSGAAPRFARSGTPRST